MDTAALYFTETDYSANKPGRGGYGGFLSSDAGEHNEHLLGDSEKFLVGYPLIPGAEADWGRMYATTPTNLHFTALNAKIFRTADILSYPGNSGAPLYVEWTNGVYYPAGIYLGEGSQTLVRAIDSEVVDLINRAENSGEGGGNSTGGGVILLSAGLTAPPFGTGLLTVSLAPNDYRYWMQLGRALETANRVDDGEKALRHAVALAPAYSFPRWYFGNLLLREGKQDEAFRELVQASQADPALLPQVFNLSWDLFGGDVIFLECRLLQNIHQYFERLIDLAADAVENVAEEIGLVDNLNVGAGVLEPA